MVALILFLFSNGTYVHQDTLVVENWEGASFSSWHFDAWEVGTAPRLGDYYPPNYDSILNPNHAHYNDFDSSGDSSEIEAMICHMPVGISWEATGLFVYFEYGFRHRNKVDDAFGFYVDFHSSGVWEKTGPWFYSDSSISGYEEINLSHMLLSSPDSARFYWVYSRNHDKFRGWGVAIDSVFAYTTNRVTGIEEEENENAYDIRDLYFGYKEIEERINSIRHETDVEIFDLLGRKIDKFERGVCFIRIKGRGYKVIIL